MIRTPDTSWIDVSTVKHLRFPFSFFLLPVFLFALSQAVQVEWQHALLSGFILHLLIFPSSNGYNSYQDRDTGSIGGLKYPPPVTEKLFYITLAFDGAAILLSLLLSGSFALLVLIFIVVSRLYSYRKVRLKKYPLTAFLTVFFFQGAFVYFIAVSSFSEPFRENLLSLPHLQGMIISSLFIGSMYPLTQIYQHQSDKDDGVVSLSYRLGYNGTFVFSGMLFATGTLLLSLILIQSGQIPMLFLFLFLLFPAILHLSRWFILVRKDCAEANYEQTMKCNLLASLAMNLFFSFLIIHNHFLA
ncbi:MAG: UbiA family prenyltransferase [Mangrovibacterium sp.]